VPNRTVPKQIALNWNMQGQTKPHIAKALCMNKTENRPQLKLTDTIFFLEFYPSSYFSKKYIISEAGSISVFRQRST
jgi:hypothetical protein